MGKPQPVEVSPTPLSLLLSYSLSPTSFSFPLSLSFSTMNKNMKMDFPHSSFWAPQCVVVLFASGCSLPRVPTTPEELWFASQPVISSKSLLWRGFLTLPSLQHQQVGVPSPEHSQCLCMTSSRYSTSGPTFICPRLSALQ